MARVLAIDDDPWMLMLIEHAVAAAGHEVVKAADGAEGLARLRELRPDAVLCDVEMPRMSGFEVLQAVRAEAQFDALPFILLTSFDDRENIRRGLRLGADDFLSKPVRPEELVDCVARTLDKRRRLSSLVSANALASNEEMREQFGAEIGRGDAGGARRESALDITGELALRTILTCGVQDFAAVSSRLSSAEIAAFLDGYLREVCGSVLAQGGQILKLAGDRVVAIFGQGGEAPGHGAPSALRAGLGMLEGIAAGRQAAGGTAQSPAFDSAVGIHTGLVVLAPRDGGAGERVMAAEDSVAVADLLRRHAGQLGWPMAASGDTAGHAGSAFAVAETRELNASGNGAAIRAMRVEPVHRSAAGPGRTPLPGGAIGIVLGENARSGATASKAALDRSLRALADGDGAGGRDSGVRAPPTIRGYRIERRIGEGGMSIVYLADDEKRGGKVVLKVLKGRRGDDQSLWRRFFQECEIMSSIEHEHVIRIFDHGFGDELAYISMEYLGGGSLNDLLARGITPREAMSLLSQAAGALDAIHRRAIVHRDVKPANFLLREEGVLVLTDFGAAKRIDQRTSHTVLGRVMGTAWYMAPEQVHGGEITPAADIYGLGVILFEMLCGRRPFAGETLTEVISQQLVAPVPRLPERLAEYQRLVDGMLAKRPQDRYRDAAAVLEEIDRIRTAQAVRNPKE